MMSAVDDGVGRVLAELRSDGLAERTLVVYLSASGGALDANSSDNYPLRGSKIFLGKAAGAYRLQCQWPGHLPKGMIYDLPVLSLDIFATITALANAPINPAIPLDGVDLIPYLTGQKQGAPHDAIYLRMPVIGASAIRSGDYKLVIPATGKAAELYNLSKDISECKNLADVKPEVLQELEKKLTAWSRQMSSADGPGTTDRAAPAPIDTYRGLEN